MCTLIYTALIIVLSVVACYFQNKRKDPEKTLGVYARPGKWYYLKYAVFYSILQLRKLKTVFLDENRDKEQSRIETLEKLQQLSSHEKGFDAVFFQAVNMDGYYICAGTERRHKGLTFGLFYIVVPGIGLLSSMRLPNTKLQTDSVSIHSQHAYSAEGIQFTPVKPMKIWKISFNGQMRVETNPDKIYDVKLEATWTSDYPYFLYERDINSKPIARATAKEVWSRDYFEALKETHQTHYEQMGNLKGTLIVDNRRHSLTMWSFRDHSFGYKRDWALLHRYAFHMIYLKNGMRIVIGVISHPSSMSHFETGYVVHPNGIIETIESCDLQLYQHGESGEPGKTIAFTFVANKKYYVVKAIVQLEAIHYKGHTDEAKLIERFLTSDVNGIKGRGISEWHYNVGKNK